MSEANALPCHVLPSESWACILSLSWICASSCRPRYAFPPHTPLPPCSCAGSVLRAALEARSYHKELVLVANSLHKLGGLSQLVANFEALGYGHILLLSEAWDLGPRTALRP